MWLCLLGIRLWVLTLQTPQYIKTLITRRQFWRFEFVCLNRVVMLELSPNKTKVVQSGEDGFPLTDDQYSHLSPSEPFRKDRTLIKTINLTQKKFKRNSCGKCAIASKMFITTPLKTWVLTSQLSCTAEWIHECHPAFTLAQQRDGAKAGSIKVTYSLQVNCQVEVCRRDEKNKQLKN